MTANVPLPNWILYAAAPNVRSGSLDVGRQPTLTFNPAHFYIQSNPINNENVVSFSQTILTELSSSGGGGFVSGSNPGVWIDGGNKIRTTGSVAIDSSGRFAPNVGTDVVLFVSGTLTNTINQSQGAGEVVSLPDTAISGSIWLNSAQQKGVAQTVMAAGGVEMAVAQVNYGYTRIWGNSNSNSILMNTNGNNTYTCFHNSWHSFTDNAAQEAFRITSNYPQGNGITIVNPSGLLNNGTDAYFVVSGSANVLQGGQGRIAAILPDTFVSGTLQAGGAAGQAAVTIGPWPGAPTTDGAMWALPISAVPGLNNYAFLSNGTDTWFNAPSSAGTMHFYTGDSSHVGDWSVTNGFIEMQAASFDQLGKTPAQYGTDVWVAISGTNNVAQGVANRRAAVLPDTVISGGLIIQGTQTNQGTVVTQNSVVSSSLFVSGVITFAAQSSSASPTVWGQTNLFAQAYPGMPRPQLGMQWQGGPPNVALQPHISFTRQSYWRTGNNSGAGGTTAFNSSMTTRGSSNTIPSNPNLTGSYGQIWRYLNSTTSAQVNCGIEFGAQAASWVGTGPGTGGFFAVIQFALEAAGGSASSNTTGSMFAGMSDNIGSSQFGGSTAVDWTNGLGNGTSVGGFMGVGWTATLPGNNAVGLSATNWQAIGNGKHGQPPTFTNTGIQVIAQHMMQLQMYMPAGVSSSVYWTLTDMTAGLTANGQFLSSVNAVPPPLNGTSQNQLAMGCVGGWVTGSNANGFDVAVVAFYLETPY